MPLPALLYAALVIALDQFTKAMVMARMAVAESIPIIPGVLHLTHVRNWGAAFGMFPHRTPFFIAGNALVLLTALVYGFGPGGKRRALAVGLLAGGAGGNLTDRLRLGFVTDFLDVRVWPVFNVADSAIVIAAGLLILEALMGIREGR